jgi:thymidylate synthase
LSRADEIFAAMCRDIIDNGFSSEGQLIRAKWEDGSPAHTIKKFGVVNRYDLNEEFPALTLRPTAIKSATDELLWIWQKKSNSINELNSRIWDAWADEDGTIGKAYGYQLSVKHKYPEGEMDQVDRVLYDLSHNPYSRRIMTNLYNFEDLHEMAKLNAILNQRSQDVLVANNWNVVQYSILVMMLAQVSGLVPGEFVHVIADAHIYDRHISLVENMLKRPAYPAPKVKLDPGIKNFYDFRPEHVIVENYQTNPQIKNIPVAV